MGHKSTTSNTVAILKHEKVADPQPNLFADVNGLADDEVMAEFNQADASCAKWLHGLMLSREASR